MSPSRDCEPPAGPRVPALQAPYDYYMDSNLVKTCPKDVSGPMSSQSSAEACVASSENRFARMSSDANRTAFALSEPSVSNSMTIRVGSFAAFTDSTLYWSMNFLHVSQSDESMRVSSFSVDVNCMWLSQNEGLGSRASSDLVPRLRSGSALSYSFPASARIGPRWNSTSSIAIFGTSETSTRRSEFAYAGSVSSSRRRIDSSAFARTLTFI